MNFTEWVVDYEINDDTSKIKSVEIKLLEREKLKLNRSSSSFLSESTRQYCPESTNKKSTFLRQQTKNFCWDGFVEPSRHQTDEDFENIPAAFHIKLAAPKKISIESLELQFLRETCKLSSTANDFLQKSIKKGSMIVNVPPLVQEQIFRSSPSLSDLFTRNYDLIQYMESRKNLEVFQPGKYNNWTPDEFQVEHMFPEDNTLSQTSEVTPWIKVEKKLSPVLKDDVYLNFYVETPLIPNNRNLQKMSKDIAVQAKSWNSEARHLKQTGIAFAEKEAIILDETLKDKELKFKVYATSIQEENMFQKVRKYIELLKPHGKQHRWEISKYKKAQMSWMPFLKISKQKTLEEKLYMGEETNKYSIFLADKIENKTLKYVKLWELECLDLGNVSNESQLGNNDQSCICSNTTNTDDSTTFKLNVTTNEVSDILDSNKTSGSDANPTTDHVQRKKPETCVEDVKLTDSSALSNPPLGLNGLKPSCAFSNILSELDQHSMDSLFDNKSSSIKVLTSEAKFALSSEQTFSNDTVQPGHRSQRTPMKREMSEIDSLVLAKRKRTKEKPKLDALGLSFFPMLDALNHSTKNNSTTNVHLNEVDKAKNKPSQLSINEQLIIKDPMHTLLEGSVLDQEPDLKEKIMDWIPTDQMMFRRLAVNTKFPEKYPSIYFQLESLCDLHSEQLYLHEFSMFPEDSLQFDFFINETCGLIIVKPIQVYQIDIKSKELLFFKELSKIIHHVQSLVVILMLDGTHETNKTGKFLNDCDLHGVKVYQAEPDLSSMLNTLNVIIVEYGTLVEKSTSHNTDLIYEDEHQFLFSCGVVNPLLVKFLLQNITLEEFIELDHGKRVKHFSNLISVELLKDLDNSFRVAMSQS
ncbi:hypothetical protein CANARDRAFT_23328 [[Candida] arabinofermentans NRRL YB-2248]|uniref:Uncharacterized protein n=1 Tax=[Candida] arabinofermentans NRRL YB-2248 TaxID=983967 RepID=A0A1E4T0H0_9ASCO|nr:hypothetical protein CANARDRAFT_23328 [[Candida] arabinofermentans NRRL YB-2248]